MKQKWGCVAKFKTEFKAGPWYPPKGGRVELINGWWHVMRRVDHVNESTRVRKRVQQ